MRMIFLTFCCLCFPAMLWAAAGDPLRLPASANVTEANATGKTWRAIGFMSLAYAAADQSWETSLRRQGWELVRTVTVNPAEYRRLYMWEKQQVRIMVQLWRVSPEKTAFSWGVMPASRPSLPAGRRDVAYGCP